ncbi:hypothetical protein OKW41_004916 [Paraburkholderia sp. UCT70]
MTGDFPGTATSAHRQPDNLKLGVHKPGFYDPDINPTYQEMAPHYFVAVIPAGVKKRDKPKAELSVLLVQRWVIARLRNQRFFSLDDALGDYLLDLQRPVPPLDPTIDFELKSVA